MPAIHWAYYMPKAFQEVSKEINTEISEQLCKPYASRHLSGKLYCAMDSGSAPRIHFDELRVLSSIPVKASIEIGESLVEEMEVLFCASQHPSSAIPYLEPQSFPKRICARAKELYKNEWLKLAQHSGNK